MGQAGVGLIANDWVELPLFVEAQLSIASVHTVLDIGPGLRPQTLVPCVRHICLEPHYEYVDELEAEGCEVVRGAAPRALDLISDPVDTVVMFDVIEHMRREDGLETLRRARAMASRQVVVFTPLGFMPQDGGQKADAWGLNGQRWQRHRSGWRPEDFPDWKILADPDFAPGHPAFFAIWDRPA